MKELSIPLDDGRHMVELLIPADGRVLTRLVDTRLDKWIQRCLAFGGCEAREVVAYDDRLVAGMHVPLPPARVAEVCRWFATHDIEIIDERTEREKVMH